jgi:hydroxymethylpyrimidine/phosphomethylpyrimidine kinase
MKHYPCVLTIAGSDCSGGAGIQADIKTISALGAYAASAITAITVQNTCGVTDIHPVPASYVKGQIEAVMTDIRPRAIKIGMINDVNIVKVIAESLQKFKPEFVVFDPVMVSTSGCKLMEDEAIEAITSQLMPLSTLITPNLNEASLLWGRTIAGTVEMQQAAQELSCRYNTAVLVKGGHLEGNDMCDVLYCRQPSAGADVLPSGCILYSNPKIESRNLHGTGCTLSSAIATFLAGSSKLDEAVCKAKEYIGTAINRGKNMDIGHGNGPLWHFPLSE